MENGTHETKASILIVDDIPDTVQLLRDWLENHQYKATGVTSSLQALEIAAEEKPDLILPPSESQSANIQHSCHPGYS
jgi:CheY-like chemotaxis protein